MIKLTEIERQESATCFEQRKMAIISFTNDHIWMGP